MKRSILLLVVSLAAGSLGAATSDQLFTAGKLALMQNDADKAAALFEQAVKARPDDSSYHLWLGRAYGRQAQKASIFRQAGLAKQTKSEFERAVQLDPNNLDGRLELINYYIIAPGIMGGSTEKAMEQAQEIRKRDALTGHRAFARIYARDKKPDLARKEYYDAVREQPNSPKAHYFFAGYLINEKNWKQALEELDAAIRIDPSYMPAYYRLGALTVQSVSNFARGEESLKKYLAYKPAEDEPSLSGAWYWLGQIYEKQGRKAEAKQSYATSLKLAPGVKDVVAALKRVS